MAFIAECIDRFRLDNEDLDYRQFIVAVDGGEIAGFGRTRPHKEVYELGCVGVIESRRNQGLGKMIVEDLINAFLSGNVYITTDLIGYFERLGFREIKNGPEDLVEKIKRVCISKCRAGAVVMVYRKEKPMHIDTKCIHAGGCPDTHTGGINTPIFTSSAYGYLDTDVRLYQRYFNTPNQEAVAKKLCELEGAEDGVIFSSGMAAISTVLLTLLNSGYHAVVQDEIYGGSHAFVEDHFSRLGISLTLTGKEAQVIEDAIKPNTRIIYIESPTNPLLNVVDLRAVAEIGRRRGILTIIDNTFATPVNQNPFKLGIDVVLHSGTKYLGGHSDLYCGVALANKDIASRIRKTAANLGGSLNALSCYLLERSLKTLAIRVERQTQNAFEISKFLENHAKVAGVNYPGLASHPGHAIARNQMSGYGAMLSFELKDMPALAFMKQLKLIKAALSLGGVETTICDPATTSHQKVSEEVRKRLGISGNLLRLSVGIENLDDLIEDIQQALEYK
ncbi:MAG: GNAT family N-acetyltransferase [Nitrospirae bacterium]|nr:GNAT family N-acetyltransferase [Nitrospirota bacterium]